LRRPEGIEGEALAVLRKRGLQFMDGASSFDADGKVGPRMLNNFIQARGGKNDVGASGSIAPGKFRAAPARNYSKIRVICETNDVGKLLLVDGLEDKPRLNAANCFGRSGATDRIWCQDRAEFVFDSERSRCHLRDSVHYKSRSASRHAAETSIAQRWKSGRAGRTEWLVSVAAA
jgi:hypothetical protein